MQDRWQHIAPDERYAQPCDNIWELRNSNSIYEYRVVQRGPFFDAQKETFILERFTELEPAKRHVEAIAEQSPQKRKRTPEEPSSRSK